MKITDEQLKEALAAGLSQRAIAAKYSMSKSGVKDRIASLAKRGYSPKNDWTKEVPDGFKASVSTLYVDGKVRSQWVKASPDEERMRAILDAAYKGFGDTIKRTKPVAPPKHTDDSLLTCYVISDYHLGMLAWQEETGADWDIRIAESLLVEWMRTAISLTPKSGRAVFAQLGDFLHFQGLTAITPEHGNVLDADTRFTKLVRSVIRVLRQCVDMMLQKHDTVHLLMAEGNHDPDASVWLREWFAALYENEPRITVETSPDPYYCVEHGNTSLFFHHGHKRGMDGVGEVFAAKFRDVFGRTKHSYAHLGHRHHLKVEEGALMVVEQHRTLAAPDAYASRGGWMSGRDARAITYHKKYGEVSRVAVTPDMVCDRIREGTS